MKYDKLIKKKLEKSLNENSNEPVIAINATQLKSPRFKNRTTSKDGHLNYPLVGRRFHEDDITDKVIIVNIFTIIIT